MYTTLRWPILDSLALLRRELTAEGLETAAEWDSALDLRDTMGPQIAETRCIFAFDPLSLLHYSKSGKPASALAILTVQSLGALTAISLSGHGPSYQKASIVLSRCSQQLPPLRHAA